MKKISRLFVLCVALTGMTIFGCSKKAQTGGTSTAENTPQEKVSKKLAPRVMAKSSFGLHLVLTPRVVLILISIEISLSKN